MKYRFEIWVRKIDNAWKLVSILKSENTAVNYAENVMRDYQEIRVEKWNNGTSSFIGTVFEYNCRSL